MKKVILITLLVWTTVQTFSQTHFALDSVSYKFRIDTLYSDTLKETRFIKISFPPDYKKENKYPVFFVLDEDWMFEPTITNVKQLMEANIIPPAIVIGIHSKNRSKDLRLGLDGSFTESSRKFYHYISSEIIEYLSKNYTSPAFPILIGHSDGAVFSQKVLTQPNQPFRGIISLSIQLASGQFEEIKKFTQQHFSNHIYHFVASGSKDGTSRLNSALKIDSLFQTVNNPNIHLKTTIYNTDHFGVGIRGLNDGISFIFNDYMQENDFNEPLLDSLRKANSNPVAIIKEYLKKIEAIYNIEVLPKEEGIISVANAIITNRKQLEELWEYRVKLYGKDESYNASYAQSLERINEYDEALKYWVKNLTDTSSFSNNYFYYQRPIELLSTKMNKGKEALKFIEEWQTKKPEYLLYFNYSTALICADKKIEIAKGKKAIKYFIDNYKSNGKFSLDAAKIISDNLNKL